MAKKKLSQIEELQRKIETAQSAVSKLTDESLKVVAFQTVLQNLLASEEKNNATSDETLGAEKSNHEPSHGSKRPRGPKGRIEELIVEGFFTQKKTIGDVKDELAKHTWHHRVEELQPSLIRLVQEKKLRRIKEPEGDSGKLVWRYSNW